MTIFGLTPARFLRVTAVTVVASAAVGLILGALDASDELVTAAASSMTVICTIYAMLPMLRDEDER